MMKNIYLRKKYLDWPAVDVMGTAVLALTWGCIMIAWAWSGLGARVHASKDSFLHLRTGGEFSFWNKKRYNMTAAPLLSGRGGGAHWCEVRAAVSILTPAPGSQHIASVWWTWRHGDLGTWTMWSWGIITNRAARRLQRTSTRQLRHHTRGDQPRLGSQQISLNTLHFTLITGG